MNDTSRSLPLVVNAILAYNSCVIQLVKLESSNESVLIVLLFVKSIINSFACEEIIRCVSSKKAKDEAAAAALLVRIINGLNKGGNLYWRFK